MLQRKEEQNFYKTCAKGDLRAIEYFIQDPKVEVNKLKKSSDTPFQATCEAGHPRVDVNEGAPLYTACKNGHIAVLEFLAQNPKIDVNKSSRSKFSRPPFAEAYTKWNLELVKLLAANSRIDFNQADHKGRTEFFRAFDSNAQSVIDFFAKDQRVDITKADIINKPVLQEALYNYTTFAPNKPELIKIIVPLLLNPNVKNNKLVQRYYNKLQNDQNLKNAIKSELEALLKSSGKDMFALVDTITHLSIQKLEDLLSPLVGTESSVKNYIKNLKAAFAGSLFSIMSTVEQFQNDYSSVKFKEVIEPQDQNKVRFLKIAAKLNIDTQQVLCNRVAISCKDTIENKYILLNHILSTFPEKITPSATKQDAEDMSKLSSVLNTIANYGQECDDSFFSILDTTTHDLEVSQGKRLRLGNAQEME